ncbi:ferritin-like domain-containing protein [Henriciella aquimarina]|uniref:ferritin-like domain-containing protein n=1 Tax=Henriciella aquimarina TaxID=545261 RepID=UPI001301ED73|nr:DUF2202 domain-containing protein [Henriciella aquimarina]
MAEDKQSQGEPTGSLPESVVHALGLALEDERRAFETYSAILDRFEGARPFANIVNAEARHIAALLRIYERYGLTPPTDETLPEESALTAPFEALCEIGVQAEIENIRLFDETLLPAVAAYPDIAHVFQRLRDASAHNHLAAFRRCAERGAPGRRPCGSHH